MAGKNGPRRVSSVSPTTSEYQYPGQKGFCEILASEFDALAVGRTIESIPQ